MKEFFPWGGKERHVPLPVELGLVAATIVLGNVVLPPVLRYLNERRGLAQSNTIFGGTWVPLEFEDAPTLRVVKSTETHTGTTEAAS